jgi:hypothetical protein
VQVDGKVFAGLDEAFLRQELQIKNKGHRDLILRFQYKKMCRT